MSLWTSQTHPHILATTFRSGWGGRRTAPPTGRSTAVWTSRNAPSHCHRVKLLGQREMSPSRRVQGVKHFAIFRTWAGNDWNISPASSFRVSPVLVSLPVLAKYACHVWNRRPKNALSSGTTRREIASFASTVEAEDCMVSCKLSYNGFQRPEFEVRRVGGRERRRGRRCQRSCSEVMQGYGRSMAEWSFRGV